MGIDPISIALIGVAISAVSAGVGIVGNIAAANSSASAAAAQKNANAVTNAQAQVNQINSRRQAVREDRIRRAKILQASTNTGTNNSSGALGAVGDLTTNLADSNASSLGITNSNNAINSYNQQAQDFQSQAQFISGITGGIQNGLDRFNSVFDQKPPANSQQTVF